MSQQKQTILQHVYIIQLWSQFGTGFSHFFQGHHPNGQLLHNYNS